MKIEDSKTLNSQFAYLSVLNKSYKQKFKMQDFPKAKYDAS